MNAVAIWGRLRRLAGFRISAVLLVIVGIAALVPGLVVSQSPGSHDPRQCRLRAPDGTYQVRLPPSSRHWFGTDQLGCDEFARVVFGTRTSLGIALGATVLLTIVGTVVGLLAGCRGGWMDSIVRRSGDVTLAIPFVVGAILLLSLLAGDQRSPAEIALTLSVLGWPAAARIARNAARQIMVLTYIEASRAAGARLPRIILRHVFPNTLPAILAFATPTIGVLIGAEATLSFLGVGLQVPSVSWGLMIDRAQAVYRQAPHLVLFPGLMLVAAIAGFTLLGDAINDSLDVHLELPTADKDAGPITWSAEASTTLDTYSHESESPRPSPWA